MASLLATRRLCSSRWERSFCWSSRLACLCSSALRSLARRALNWASHAWSWRCSSSFWRRSGSSLGKLLEVERGEELQELEHRLDHLPRRPPLGDHGRHLLQDLLEPAVLLVKLQPLLFKGKGGEEEHNFPPELRLFRDFKYLVGFTRTPASAPGAAAAPPPPSGSAPRRAARRPARRSASPPRAPAPSHR